MTDSPIVNLPAPPDTIRDLPPILLGKATPEVQHQVERFYFSVADLYQSWLNRRPSPHTRRAYDQDVMNFARGFLGLDWPDQAHELLRVSVHQAQSLPRLAGRPGRRPQNHQPPHLLALQLLQVSRRHRRRAPPAHHRRPTRPMPSSCPASSSDPVDETQALSSTAPATCSAFADGDELLARRDRAILHFYVFSGARLATGCRLKVADFHTDGDAATIKINEKGEKRRTIGLHSHSRPGHPDYIDSAGLKGGPLFRPQQPFTRAGADAGRPPLHRHRHVQADRRLPRPAPRGVKEEPRPDGTVTPPLPLHAALAAHHHRHPAAGERRGHLQGAGTARPPPRHHDADLRQAPPPGPRGRLPRHPDLGWITSHPGQHYFAAIFTGGIFQEPSTIDGSFSFGQ